MLDKTRVRDVAVATATLAEPENRIAILQPAYLPWLGFFDQMARVDQFVFLDDVQFTRRDWRNRNRIRTNHCWSWLTVPVLSKHRYNQSLRETRLDNSVTWRRKHLEALRHNYARAPFFDLHFPYFDSIYQKEWNYLIDLCFETLSYLKEALGIDTPTLCSSELNVEGDKDEKILNLCHRLQADHYLTGEMASAYLVKEKFLRHRIHLEYHQYIHTVYRQQYEGFVPYLSVVDVLFNEGNRSLEIITQGEEVVTPGL
jgi:hypothetical protein